MTLLGPMVVVAEKSAADLIDILGRAGAFPIVESRFAEAPAAIAAIKPAALAIAEPGEPADRTLVEALRRAIETLGGPFMPVIARVTDTNSTPMLGALPVDVAEPVDCLLTRIRSALRVRTLHATVLRRAEAVGLPPIAAPAVLGDDLLEDASVLCVGRGRTYPALSVAIGQRVGVVGSLSVEAAAHCLGVRDIDGVVIGDGLSSRVVGALLTAIAEDARFRDLPVGLLGTFDVPANDALPNLIVADGPEALVARLLPYVRLQALEGRFKRMLKSLETRGMVDPATGLLEFNAFWNDLDKAVVDAAERGSGLSVARINFEGPIDRRAGIDAARLLSRLVRDIDIACQDTDGSILIAFTETDLRAAHVVARRITSALRQTMIAPGRDRHSIAPTLTLATLKPKDDLYSLMARIAAHPLAAAE